MYVEISKASDYTGENFQEIRSDKADFVINIADARCSVYLGQGEAKFGHFYAKDKESGDQVIQALLKFLKEKNIKKLIGPINGSTWKKYRFMEDISEIAPYFLEPTNPPFYLDIMFENGFEVIGTYFSSVGSPDYTDKRATKLQEKFKEIVVRNMQEADLPQLYELSVESFSSNYLYSDIPYQEFAELYLPLMKKLPEGFAKVAADKGKIIGFLFTYPNLTESSSGAISTLILKTVAISKKRQYAGLGVYLVDLAHKIARVGGFKKIIHALMYDGNNSKNISDKFEAEIFRKYYIYGKEI